ncbi:hypothetical protein FS837_004120 [Tulasnella sp. UAMH 9824]|nr:hypothetical protein FS837_004120 [Tulasnella sp. UAMH 9824]
MAAQELLDQLDAKWYSKLNPRWMDLLGDYVGNELFLIDGDAICQQALNDPLLALGKSQDCSFQLLHAVWNVEKLVSEFVSRRCNFEIVFFEGNEHLTLYGGADTGRFVVSSRRLARTILKIHLQRLGVVVTSFESPEDKSWALFTDSKQPMCLLCNDGSQFATVDRDDVTTNAVLLQRHFIFTMMSNGVAVVSLEATDFRGSKILSFVYEQNPLLKEQKKLVKLVIKCRENALEFLPEPQPQDPVASSTTLPTQSIETWAQAATDEYFQSNAQDTTNDALFAVFLLHLIVLPYVSISERSQKPVTFHPRLESKLRAHVMPKLLDALNEGLMKHGAERRPDIDGRVFVNLLVAFTNDPTPAEDLSVLLGPGPADGAKSLAVSFHQHVESGRLSFSPVALSRALSRWRYDEVDVSLPPSGEVPLRLLPFHNDVFDECLKPIHLASEVTPDTDTSSSSSSSESSAEEWELDDISVSQEPGCFTNTTTFADDQRWHNTRKITFKETRLVLYGEKRDDDRPLSKEDLKYLKRRKERNYQTFMRDIHRHATTLTGARGAPLQRVVIPIAKRLIKDLPTKKEAPSQRCSSLQSSPVNPKPRKESKAQQVKLTSAEKLRQKIQEAKAVKTMSESEVWWKQQLAQMGSLPLEQKAELLGRIRGNARRMEDLWLRTETLLYQVHLDVSRWIRDSESDEPRVQAQYCVSILRAVSEIHKIGVASDEAEAFLRSLFETIGIPDLEILEPSSARSTETTKRVLTFQPVRFAHHLHSNPPLYPFLELPSHFIDFQLEHYGVYMDRSMDGQYDSRVSFIPDAWQRNVLDRLDKRESVLVVAPTSAGKTFISYYAMEQVLRESDDGVLVYVAPTKPLVNQIVSEISARFEKAVKSGTVWAAHTRDWRVHEPHKCQILVTVPEMLAIMLLSPVLAATWVPRLRWIVLDEIHSIGQQEGGAVWEQLLLFAPCPIIGLSATIGNPEEFSQWLESVQEQHGFKYALIQHKHRYSHLRKFAYTMSQEPIEFKDLSSEPQPAVRPIHIHPMSVLLSGTRVLPEDLALESRDCLTLFQAMLKVADQSYEKQEQLAELEPRKFFTRSQGRLLSQRDVLDYEARLKSLLVDWSKEPGAYDRILRPIGETLSRGQEECEARPDRKEIYMNLIHVVHDLQWRGNLPAILFNFDRHDCEAMARRLLKELKSAEKEWKESSTQYQNKLAKWKDWVAASKQKKKVSGRAKKTKSQEDEILMEANSWEQTFDPDDPLPEFSFAGQWTSYSKSELKEDIDDLKRAGVQPWAMDALKVGIAVHHAGMNRKYRTLIESLFRIGFVRVVIATGTLALGINMPVKTSVFVGDSVYLTALTYRQCAGRAGRRGMDLLGNVVFYGIPMERIHRIMTSKVPPLAGNMPLTTTLSLRLCNLLHGSQQAPSAVNAINSSLRLPQLSLASNIMRDEVLHHLRFSIDYLRRTNLLSARGEPLIMFPLVAHLYHTEPSNLALVALLQGGVLHRICASIDHNPMDTKRSLVAIISRLFARRLLPRLYSGEGALERLRPPNCPSRIILPPLSHDAYRTLSEHNDLILETFRGYANSYATQYLSQTPDNTLPLSKESLALTADQNAPFMLYLRRKAVKVDATSSFVANSGVTDSSLRTVTDLARTTRSGLHLDKNAIPGFDDLLALDGRVVNGYILDYFTHGQVKVLTEANGIRQSDIWSALQAFLSALATLQTGLEHYMKAAAAGPNLESESSDEGGDPGDEGRDANEGDTLEPGATSIFPVKPAGITDGDWKLYRAVVLTKREFEEKFKTTWT